jgi:hypothetical protein
LKQIKIKKKLNNGKEERKEGSGDSSETDEEVVNSSSVADARNQLNQKAMKFKLGGKNEEG